MELQFYWYIVRQIGSTLDCLNGPTKSIHVVIWAPDLNGALLKRKLTKILFRTLLTLDQFRHVFNFRRSPVIISVYAVNVALLVMIQNVLKLARSVASFRSTTMCSNRRRLMARIRQ